MALTSMSKSSELIYTSAPQGLRPGSRGFCTVAMSESMPAGLVGPLESLSAYRHIGGDGPPPVNFMHVQMKVAGRPVNVLSRIAEAPPDYTGRTNKIAHHVVVATADRAAGGPAAVLRQSGFAVEVWDGEVRKIPEPKTIPPADSPLRIAHTWAAESGDAGWAGTVASMLDSRTPGPPLYLICQPEQNAQLLALVDEAICLLPESKRWSATFSTYTGELPPGMNCQLRCLIAGSPEALALPRSAMTLDLATGRLRLPTGHVDFPPPSPLVDAARSGQLETPVPVKQSEISVQSGIPAAANPSASFDANELGFPAPPPPRLPPGRQPSSPHANSSSSRRYRWLLLVAALLLLCIGVAASLHFLQTDSGDLLAELNASAGIENPPTLEVSLEVMPEPEVEPARDAEPEPETEMVIDTVAEAVAADTMLGQTAADSERLESLEELAKRVLAGHGFLGDEDEKSIIKFSDKVAKELPRVEEQNKQLEELPIHPTEEQLAMWVRAEDGMEQLTGFIETRKKDVDTLKQHLPLKDLQDHRKRLAGEFKAWNIEAKKWEDERIKQSELILQISDSDKVEQTIREVREIAIAHLQKSMTSLLDQYKKLSNEKNEVAASIKKQLDDLAADLQRRRDSHRLKIYFDGDPSRREGKLQIKPRCEIVLKRDDPRSINRLSVDGSKPIPLSQSSGDTKLPGTFGWLTVTRGDSGIILQFDLNQKNMLPAARQQYPILQQLDQFVKQQDVVFDSARSLKTALVANRDKAENGISQWRDEDKDNKENKGKEKRNEEAVKWRQAISKMMELVNQPPKSELNQLYIKQTDQTVKDLRSHKSDVVDVFRKFVTPDVAIGAKFDEHIKNLESLRDNYNALMKNNGLLDFKGQLVFGKSLISSSEQSATNFGQSSFEPIETFELFFFPELVYGPPPKE